MIGTIVDGTNELCGEGLDFTRVLFPVLRVVVAGDATGLSGETL
ncbi:unannotated protein [freshwater metagenome]|uniref:Unannotated protein n=1 Tax=freshwater metagenome TaxID=449393 RepID=A0A6J6E5M5_9ZZZZ